MPNKNKTKQIISYSACLMLIYNPNFFCPYYEDGLCKHIKYCSQKGTWKNE
jgi:hypothetical protein